MRSDCTQVTRSHRAAATPASQSTAPRGSGLRHGGQILVSGKPRRRCLRTRRKTCPLSCATSASSVLKDLDRPVRLYQADADGLPAEFPPLRPLCRAGAGRPGWAALAALREVIAAAALVLAALIAATAALLLRDEPAPVAVPPNSVAVIDPESDNVVDTVPVETRPGPVAFGAGSVWVGNLDDQTVTRIDSRAEKCSPSYRARPPDADGTRVRVRHRLGGARPARTSLAHRPAVQRGLAADPRRRNGLGSPNGSVAVGLGSIWAVFGDSTLARIEP